MGKRMSFISIVLVGLLLLVGLIGTGVAAADLNGGAPLVATLTGAAETGGGDPDGSGSASVILNYGQGTVCWQISFDNIEPPSASHIHGAPAGVSGPVLIPLSPISGGCADVDKNLIKAIIQNPDQYYVNVHNADFRAGAVRGQLSNRGQGK